MTQANTIGPCLKYGDIRLTVKDFCVKKCIFSGLFFAGVCCQLHLESDQVRSNSLSEAIDLIRMITSAKYEGL